MRNIFKNENENNDMVEDPTTGKEYTIPPIMVIPQDKVTTNNDNEHHTNQIVENPSQ